MHVMSGTRSYQPGDLHCTPCAVLIPQSDACAGFPEHWYSWRHQLVEFREDYEVAAFDMRGYGDSDRPQVPPPASWF